MRGKVWTTLGPIEPSQLGITLPHEHLFVDCSMYIHLAQEASEIRLARQPVSFEIIGWLRFNGLRNKDNLRLDDEDTMAEEALRFRHAGGNTIVDAGVIGIGRDVEALKRLSLRTGINVIASSGYYVAASHPREMESKTADDIKNEIVKEIRVGVSNSGVQAGLIKIGTSYPWGRNEQKTLQGAVHAQTKTGAPMEVHPGRSHRHPAMILDLLEKEGADLNRVLVCHIERTIEEFTDFRSILDRGCCVGFDEFGLTWYPPELPIDVTFPSDYARVRQIRRLIEAGYTDRIFISHDIDSKHLLHCFGGHGYAHILVNIIPLMLSQGISLEDVHKILVNNPRRLFTFA